jgi:hypothetical protein
MPKIINPAMRAHLDEETTRLAASWRITRKDGQHSFSPITTGTSTAPMPGSSARRSGAMPGSRPITSTLDAPDAEDRHNSIGRDLIGQT